MLSTAASRTGAAIASAVGTVSNAYNDTDYYRRQIQQEQTALDTGHLSDGRQVTEQMRRTLEGNITDFQKKIEELESGSSFTNRVYTAANTMRDDSRKHEESASRGLARQDSLPWMLVWPAHRWPVMCWRLLSFQAPDLP